MDGVPTLNAFALIFQWITNNTIEPAENLPWGTEWLNLPLGPVNATGGPRQDWDIAGVDLLKQLSDSKVPHTVCFPLNDYSLALFRSVFLDPFDFTAIPDISECRWKNV